jgi:GAF domain-containing protein
VEIKPEILGWIVQGYSASEDDLSEVDESRPVGRLASQVLRLTALHHISRAASGSLQLDEMLTTVVQVVAEAVGTDACSVFLFDNYSDTLMLRATHGLNPAAVGRVVIRSDNTNCRGRSQPSSLLHVPDCWRGCVCVADISSDPVTRPDATDWRPEYSERRT